MPDHFAVLDYRQVTNPPVGHDGHALVDLRPGTDDDQGRRHDFADGDAFVRRSLVRDPAQVVPLGDDAGHLAAVHHDQGADVRVDHLLDRLEHGSVRLDLQHVLALVAEDLRHLVHASLLGRERTAT